MKFKTRAKTAYSYLTAIAAIIMEEPKRLNMGVVVLRGDGLEAYIADGHDGAYLQEHKPSCGTVGCVAGWALTLAGRVGDHARNAMDLSEATQLLGLSDAQEWELFMPSALISAKDKQTRAHAVATVKHIRAFQKKYATQLKRTRVPAAQRLEKGR